MEDFDTLKKYYDDTLNTDKSTYTSSNDEPTPIDCVCEMIDAVPEDLWKRKDLSILDPCCGNGNFHLPIFFKLREHHETRDILENILEFNDLNTQRLQNVSNVFCQDSYKLQISSKRSEGYASRDGKSRTDQTTEEESRTEQPRRDQALLYGSLERKPG